ncbi:MAG: 3'-5' exonuclease, partial [Patescibacteria group bacterium]
GFDPKTHDPNAVLSTISKQKGRGISVEEWGDAEYGGYFLDVVAHVWPEYEKTLKREGALDFDDLLLKTSNLLRNEKGVKEHYQNVWRYIHIDEYQDTNRVQYEISRMLTGPNGNICVVGDIDQNIYSWRGADLRNILDFEKDYPQAQVITLEKNYRSTKTILQAANAIIEKNKIRRKKNLFTENATGEKIVTIGLLDEVTEAAFVARKAEELIKNGAHPDEIAVLYRANFQSRVLEEAFMNLGLPYQILGTRFFERKEVKDVISYLRAALNPEGLSDIKRIINTPTRGIGKTTIVKIFAGATDSLPAATKSKIASFRRLLSQIAKVSGEKKVSETISFIIKESGLEAEWKEGGDDGAARLENAYELVNFALRYDNMPPDERISSFLSEVALQSDQDELKEERKAVRLMTVHAAKGLEFDIVFIAGLEDGLFPHQRMNKSDITAEEAEEERRLFYVALTRARKKVFLSYAQIRTTFGRKRVNMPSEFIFDIPGELIEEETFHEDNPIRKPLLNIDF